MTNLRLGLNPSLSSMPQLQLFVAAAAVAAAVAVAASAGTPAHSTAQLSQARSDLGAATAGGAAVFGGGCSKGSSAGGGTGGSCVGPSAVIDILRPSSAAAGGWGHAVYAQPQPRRAELGSARGWASTCAFGPEGDTVAFLGGGNPRGSQALDLLSVSTGTVRFNRTALPWRTGRWGIACAGSATQLTFAGGKIYPKMTAEVLVLPAGASGGGCRPSTALALP